MRMLVVADIHSNWAALSAIDERFDVCLFLGDLVDYGVDPVPCVNWVRRNAAVAIRGNHDHAVAQRVAARPGAGYRGWAAATRPLQWEQLGRSDLFYLSRLQVTRQLTLDGRKFHLVHATPRDPLDEYLADDAEAWASRLRTIDADYVLVGHTHLPYDLTVGKTRVINAGSVGQPRDGDPRASYAVIDQGRVELKRVAYDIDAAVSQMRQAGLAEEWVEQAEFALRTGGRFPVPAAQPSAE